MKQQTFLEAIKDIPLFSELDLHDLMQIARSCSIRKSTRRTILFQEGDTYRGFYIVLRGGVKVYKLAPDGKETILHVLFPPQPLAEIPMFVGGGYPAHAETLEESELLFVQKEGFLEQVHSNPDLAIKMLAGLSKRLKLMGTQIEKLTSMDVRTRLVRFFLDEYERQKPNAVVPFITLPIAKSLLAAHLGTVLETLSRNLKKLESEGLIRVVRRKIVLENLQELQTLFRKNG